MLQKTKNILMISVVVPIYNSRKYLKDCPDSIRNQTVFDFEVLCIDDGSTDNSKSVCESFANEDARFILYTKRNGGVSSARNLGLEIVKGEYVCFIESDDIIANDYLEYLKELSQTGDFCICNYTRSINELAKGTIPYDRYSVQETQEWMGVKQFKDRLMINRGLGYGWKADIYGFAMFCIQISPVWIKVLIGIYGNKKEIVEVIW